ncbi:hypothetical protein HY224_03500 [Candidatus Uhrbacteria bacterium]|nr:hypothetical protein [Candidatus Uhrbacteria bacterium]
MTTEKWLDLLNMIEDKFQVETKETVPMEEGPGEVSRIIFSLPNGRFKLERTVKPRVLDKKTSYTHRAGGDVKVDYVYSDSETVDKLAAFKWNDQQDSWTEVEADTFTS